MFAAVNESVWEHLKLAFWPGVLWALLEARTLSLRFRSIMAVKGFSLLLTSIMIIVIFSSYTSILGRNLLPLDIGTFVLAIMIGQVVSAMGLMNWLSSPSITRAGQVLLLSQVAAFSTFTFHRPYHWLFIDSRTGLTGFQPG